MVFPSSLPISDPINTFLSPGSYQIYNVYTVILEMDSMYSYFNPCICTVKYNKVVISFEVLTKSIFC